MTTTKDSATDLPQVRLLIDGEWRLGGGGTLVDLNPATEEPAALVSAASADDVEAAVASARRAFHGTWSEMSGDQRGRILHRVAELIERDGDLLARLEALDIGKPVHEPTLVDVPNTALTFRHFAGWADKITGATVPTTGYDGRPTHSFTVREPVGVVGANTSRPC